MEFPDLNHLIDDHALYPAVLENLLGTIDDERLRRRPAADRWSPLEILAHIADLEIADFRSRAQLAAAGRPIETGIDPEAWVTEREYNKKDPAEVLQGFGKERELSCRWLRGVSETDLESGIDHAKLGRMRCGDFIAAWRMHDLLHLRQLATTLSVLAAHDLAGWRADYAGKLPSI